MMSTWFITGCSTGLGRALAAAVLEAGDNAVITARSTDTLAAVVQAYPDHALAVRLDVADHQQVLSALQQAQQRFGGIDVLVNNAGHGYRSAVEEGDTGDVKELFDSNFFGAVDLIKQTLPDMRTRRSGVIINISSIAGRTSNPGSGYYSASKFALEGLSYALRMELAPLGIRVVVVEPGAFRTDFAGRSLHQSPRAIEDYAQTSGLRRKEHDHSDGTQPGDPARAAQAIRTIAADKNPPLRVVLGSDAISVIDAELNRERAELDGMRQLSASTDFPL